MLIVRILLPIRIVPPAFFANTIFVNGDELCKVWLVGTPAESFIVIVAVPVSTRVPVFARDPKRSRLKPVLIVRLPFPIDSELQTAPATLITGLRVAELIMQVSAEVGIRARFQFAANAQAVLVPPVQTILVELMMLGLPRVTAGAYEPLNA